MLEKKYRKYEPHAGHFHLIYHLHHIFIILISKIKLIDHMMIPQHEMNTLLSGKSDNIFTPFC